MAQLTCAINKLVAQLSANPDRIACTTVSSSSPRLPVTSALSPATTHATAGQCATYMVDCLEQRDHDAVKDTVQSYHQTGIVFVNRSVCPRATQNSCTMTSFVTLGLLVRVPLKGNCV